MCYFYALSKITGKSAEDLFTQYKNEGYAFNPTFGVYFDQAAAFLQRNNYGFYTSTQSMSNYINDTDAVVVGFATIYINGAEIKNHAVMINKDNGSSYECTDATTDQHYPVNKSNIYQGGAFVMCKR